MELRSTLFVPLLAFLAGIAISACSSLTTTPRLNDQVLEPGLAPVAHVHAGNWGIYLFNLIPLITGDSRTPGFVRFFSDEVRVEKVVDTVTRRCKKLGATHASDLHSHFGSRWCEFGGVFWIRWAEVSANASRPDPLAELPPPAPSRSEGG